MILRPMAPPDALEIPKTLTRIGWPPRDGLYERYLEEQARGDREAWVAEVDAAVAGYLTVVWQTGYAPFRDAGIPEICDLNVWPEYRRRGIATALMDLAEARIATRGDVAGIGVGMYPDYGPAQILYVRRGYVPDGRGLVADDRPVAYGDRVVVDDSLVLHLTRRLR